MRRVEIFCHYLFRRVVSGPHLCVGQGLSDTLVHQFLVCNLEKLDQGVLLVSLANFYNSHGRSKKYVLVLIKNSNQKESQNSYSRRVEHVLALKDALRNG